MSEVTVRTPQKRDSNLELFRIITMLFIVAHHYVVNSGLMAQDGPIYGAVLSLPSQFLLMFGAFGKTGINCFVLITGYFMCKSRITASKFFKLLFEIMFYKIVIGLIFMFSGYQDFSLKVLAKMLMPFMSVKQNFPDSFLLFFLFIPFLNVLVKHLSHKQHVLLLLLCAVTYIFFGTVPFFQVDMNYVSWFMVLFLMGSYIRLYPKKVYERTGLWGLLMALSLLMSLLSVLACSWLGTRLNRNMAYTFVQDANTLLAVTNGVTSFLFFKNLKIKHSKWINALGASTFGVLLIHSNSDTMRQWLWKDVLDNVGMYSSPWMPVHAIVSILVIFLVCSGVDYLRIHFLEKPFMKWWDKVWDKCSYIFRKLENKVANNPVDEQHISVTN